MKYIGAAFLLFLAACGSGSSGSKGQSSDTTSVATASGASPTSAASVVLPPDTSTLGGRWYLEPVLASDTAAGKVPWLDLNLELSRFTGNTGCNSMHGKFYFSRTDSSLSFGDKIAISKRVCTGFNETAFLKSLQRTGRYKLRNDTLILIGDDRSELSRWMRRPATAPKTMKT